MPQVSARPLLLPTGLPRFHLQQEEWLHAGGWHVNKNIGQNVERVNALTLVAHPMLLTGCSHPHLSFGLMALILGSSSQVMLH